MAFRPDSPTSSDYRSPFPAWIVDAIPGAADLRDKAAAADAIQTAAWNELVDAREKLGAISRISRTADSYEPVYSPDSTAKRTTWDKADDRHRAAQAAYGVATISADHAYESYWTYVMDGQDAEAFVAQTEPLYAAASARAQEHLEALRAAITERDDFLSALGRRLNLEHGNYGLRNALSEVSAYVAAGLVDEEAAAWSTVTAALDAGILMPGDRARILTLCREVRVNKDLSPREKAARYRAILAADGETR